MHRRAGQKNTAGLFLRGFLSTKTGRPLAPCCVFFVATRRPGFSRVPSPYLKKISVYFFSRALCKSPRPRKKNRPFRFFVKGVFGSETTSQPKMEEPLVRIPTKKTQHLAFWDPAPPFCTDTDKKNATPGIFGPRWPASTDIT